MVAARRLCGSHLDRPDGWVRSGIYFSGLLDGSATKMVVLFIGANGKGPSLLLMARSFALWGF